jgi:hypothetical protein
MRPACAGLDSFRIGFSLREMPGCSSARHGLSASALPLAQTRLRGLSAIGNRRSRLSEFGEPSDELGLRLEHRSCGLVAAVAGSDSSRGLLFPTAHAGWKGPPFRGLCLPASFRPQGLVTLSTVFSLSQPGRFCFAPAALLGLALRSFLLPGGRPSVSASPRPTYR